MFNIKHNKLHDFIRKYLNKVVNININNSHIYFKYLKSF